MATSLRSQNKVSLVNFADCYKIISPIYESIKENTQIKHLLGDKFDSILQLFAETSNKHPQIINANKPQEKVKIRAKLAKDFKELWHIINTKATISYRNINKDALIDSIAKAFNQVQFQRESIHYERKIYDAKSNKITTLDSNTLSHKDYVSDIQKDINALLLDFAQKCALPLTFVVEIYNALKLNISTFLHLLQLGLWLLNA